MNSQDKILSFLSANPGSETAAIVAGTGLTAAAVGTGLWNLKIAEKVHREEFMVGKARRYRNYVAAGAAVPLAPLEPPKPKAEPRPVVELSTTSTPLGATLAECIDKLASAMAAEIAIKLEGLLTAHVDQLTKSIPAVVTEALVPAPLEEPVTTDSSEPAVPRKSVIICGLWDHLHRFVLQEFRECFDITCFNPDEHPSRIAAKAKNADYVIVMSSYVRHAFTDNVNAGGAKPINVTGSMSMLRKKLTELYVES